MDIPKLIRAALRTIKKKKKCICTCTYFQFHDLGERLDVEQFYRVVKSMSQRLLNGRSDEKRKDAVLKAPKVMS